MIFRRQNSSPSTFESLRTEDSEETYLNPLLEDLDEPSNATEAYKSAMTCIGSSTARSSQSLKSRSLKAKADCSALIREDEYVDDWLIDDLQPMKRRKMDVNGLFSTGTSKAAKKQTNSGITSNHRTEEKRKQKSKLVKFGIDDSDLESGKELDSKDADTDHISHTVDMETDSRTKKNNVIEDLDDIQDIDSDSDSEIPQINRAGSKRSNLSKPKQTKITNFGTRTSTSNILSSGSVLASNSIISSVPNSFNLISKDSDISHISIATLHNPQPSFTSGPVAGVIKVKVQIKDKLLLIPIMDR